jgi:O-antigen ligase
VRALAATPPAAAPVAMSVRTWGALVVTAALPFTYALTIPIGFPLKVYEMILVALGLMSLLDGRLRMAPGTLAALTPMLWLWPWAAAGLAYRLAYPLATFNGAGFTPRFGPAGDGITKLLYFAMALYAFVVLTATAYEDARRMARWWIAGAVLAAAYGWVLLGTSALGFPAPLLPGMETPQMINIAGREVYRAGTFEEGNFFGMYLLCSTAVAMWLRWRWIALALSLSVLITFSTANVIAMSLFWAVLVLVRAGADRDPRGKLVAAAFVLGAGLFALAVLLATGYLQEFVLRKLTTDEFGSKLDRLDLTVAGLRMAYEHPISGVGLSQYGYHYRSYQLTDFFAQLRERKSIQGNVYVELASELGSVGLALAIAFGRRIFALAKSGGAGAAALRAGLAGIALALATFPSFTVLFLWGFAALVTGDALRRRHDAAARGAIAA